MILDGVNLRVYYNNLELKEGAIYKFSIKDASSLSQQKQPKQGKIISISLKNGAINFTIDCSAAYSMEVFNCVIVYQGFPEIYSTDKKYIFVDFTAAL